MSYGCSAHRRELSGTTDNLTQPLAFLTLNFMQTGDSFAYAEGFCFLVENSRSLFVADCLLRELNEGRRQVDFLINGNNGRVIG